MYLDANCPQLKGNTNSAYSACQPVLPSPLYPQDNSIASLLFGSSASVKDAKVATVGSGPEITWEVSGPTGFRPDPGIQGPGFVFYFIYLFLAMLGLRCCARASHCAGFACCKAQALGVWASVVVALGLNWPLVHRIFWD